MKGILTTIVIVAIAHNTAFAQQSTAQRPRLGDTVTTASGLRYLFVKQGNGPRPQSGDLMIVHGIGLFTDGKEFWNTRTDGNLWEYNFAVDRIIRGTEEGLREVREGDRVIMIMKPELAYGERGNPGSNIPPNTTLVFDYEVMGVKSLTLARVLREGMTDNSLDTAIARARRLPNLKEHYVSITGIRAVVRTANTKQAGDGEKILALSIELAPDNYLLHQDLARAQAQRAAKADAIRSYESALRLNPKVTSSEKQNADAATRALEELRRGGL